MMFFRWLKQKDNVQPLINRHFELQSTLIQLSTGWNGCLISEGKQDLSAGSCNNDASEEYFSMSMKFEMSTVPVETYIL